MYSSVSPSAMPMGSRPMEYLSNQSIQPQDLLNTLNRMLEDDDLNPDNNKFKGNGFN